MTPAEARLILEDECLDSVIEACEHPQEGEDESAREYLKKVHWALCKLRKELQNTAERKVTKRSGQ